MKVGLEDTAAEKNRLSRFLHDEVCQSLSAVGLQLDLLRMDLGDRMPEAASRASEAQQMLDRVMARVRDYFRGVGK